MAFFTYIVLFDDYYIETRKEDLTLQHTIKFDSHTGSHALDESVTSLLECILVDRTRKWSEKDLLKLHLPYDVSKFYFIFHITQQRWPFLWIRDFIPVMLKVLILMRSNR